MRNDYTPGGSPGALIEIRAEKKREREALSLLWPSPVRDVGRWVGDEGRRIGCQRRRGSDLKPEKTLLLLDLLPGDEPDGGDIKDTACTSLVSILKT